MMQKGSISISGSINSRDKTSLHYPTKQGKAPPRNSKGQLNSYDTSHSKASFDKPSLDALSHEFTLGDYKLGEVTLSSSGFHLGTEPPDLGYYPVNQNVLELVSTWIGPESVALLHETLKRCHFDLSKIMVKGYGIEGPGGGISLGLKGFGANVQLAAMTLCLEIPTQGRGVLQAIAKLSAGVGGYEFNAAETKKGKPGYQKSQTYGLGACQVTFSEVTPAPFRPIPLTSFEQYYWKKETAPLRTRWQKDYWEKKVRENIAGISQEFLRSGRSEPWVLHSPVSPRLTMEGVQAFLDHRLMRREYPVSIVEALQPRQDISQPKQSVICIEDVRPPMPASINSDVFEVVRSMTESDIQRSIARAQIHPPILDPHSESRSFEITPTWDNSRGCPNIDLKYNPGGKSFQTDALSVFYLLKDTIKWLSYSKCQKEFLKMAKLINKYRGNPSADKEMKILTAVYNPIFSEVERMMLLSCAFDNARPIRVPDIRKFACESDRPYYEAAQGTLRDYEQLSGGNHPLARLEEKMLLELVKKINQSGDPVKQLRFWLEMQAAKNQDLKLRILLSGNTTRAEKEAVIRQNKLAELRVEYWGSVLKCEKKPSSNRRKKKRDEQKKKLDKMEAEHLKLCSQNQKPVAPPPSPSPVPTQTSSVEALPVSPAQHEQNERNKIIDLIQQEKRPEALVLLESACSKYPEDLALRNIRIYCAMEEKDYGLTIKILKESLARMDPGKQLDEYSEHMNMMAAAYAKQAKELNASFDYACIEKELECLDGVVLKDIDVILLKMQYSSWAGDTKALQANYLKYKAELYEAASNHRGARMQIACCEMQEYCGRMDYEAAHAVLDQQLEYCRKQSELESFKEEETHLLEIKSSIIEQKARTCAFAADLALGGLSWVSGAISESDYAPLTIKAYAKELESITKGAGVLVGPVLSIYLRTQIDSSHFSRLQTGQAIWSGALPVLNGALQVAKYLEYITEETQEKWSGCIGVAGDVGHVGFGGYACYQAFFDGKSSSWSQALSSAALVSTLASVTKKHYFDEKRKKGEAPTSSLGIFAEDIVRLADKAGFLVYLCDHQAEITVIAGKIKASSPVWAQEAVTTCTQNLAASLQVIAIPAESIGIGVTVNAVKGFVVTAAAKYGVATVCLGIAGAVVVIGGCSYLGYRCCSSYSWSRWHDNQISNARAKLDLARKNPESSEHISAADHIVKEVLANYPADPEAMKIAGELTKHQQNIEDYRDFIDKRDEMLSYELSAHIARFDAYPEQQAIFREELASIRVAQARLRRDPLREQEAKQEELIIQAQKKIEEQRILFNADFMDKQSKAFISGVESYVESFAGTPYRQADLKEPLAFAKAEIRELQNRPLAEQGDCLKELRHEVDERFKSKLETRFAYERDFKCAVVGVGILTGSVGQTIQKFGDYRQTSRALTIAQTRPALLFSRAQMESLGTYSQIPSRRPVMIKLNKQLDI